MINQIAYTTVGLHQIEPTVGLHTYSLPHSFVFILELNMSS